MEEAKAAEAKLKEETMLKFNQVSVLNMAVDASQVSGCFKHTCQLFHFRRDSLHSLVMIG